jgi:nucleobase:cation symporter-1, NCS1 family
MRLLAGERHEMHAQESPLKMAPCLRGTDYAGPRLDAHLDERRGKTKEDKMAGRDVAVNQVAPDTVYGRDTIEAVPHTRRDFTFWALLFIFMGMQVPVSYFITGGSVTAGLTLGQAFTTTIVAVIIGFAIFALVGVIGWQTGASTMVCTRPAFGIVGSLLPALITYIELTGWDSVHVQLAGKLMGVIGQENWGLGYTQVFSVIVGLIIVSLVVWGHKILRVMERFLVPIVVLLVIMALYAVLSGQHLGHLWGTRGPGSLTIMLAFDAMFIAILTWCPMVSDYTRYAQTRTAAFGAALIGSVPVSLFMLFVGQTAAIGLGNPNALIAMVHHGAVFSTVAFFVAMFATIATAALIMYSASMALLNVFPRIPLRYINLFTGAVVIIASISINLLGNVINWLSFQGILLIPLFSVMLVDYFVVRRQWYDVPALFERGGPYWGLYGFNLAGYGAWIVGAITYQVVHTAIPSLGGSVVSFLVAGILYWVLASFLPQPIRTSAATQAQA